MNNPLLRFCLLSLASMAALLAPLVFSRAADSTEAQAENAEEKADATEEAEAKAEYRARMTIADELVRYHARLASMTIARREGESEAKVFYTEYTRLGVSDKASRPVTFCFNGGPGSASLWLHLGGLSPRRIELLPNELEPERWELRPNAHSILDQTDLVFIDPVSTGFSRAEEPDKKGEFHGYDNDVASVSEFIRQWTATNGRWSSPQYVLGESYGGIRGVSVAQYLFDEFHYQLEGLILVSPVIDFQTLRFSESNDLPYIVFLPSYAATAWHHDRVDREVYPTVESIAEAAREFALGKYATALLRGASLPAAQRQKVVEQMSELTGLSTEYLDQSDLRVSMSRFGKELLRDEGRIVGRFDGRFSSPAWDGTDAGTEFDPSGDFIAGAFTEAIQQYYFDAFRLRKSSPYAASGDVYPWDYSAFEGRFPNAADSLRATMTQQPGMRVLFTLGYTDLATPFLGSEHTISHLDLPLELRGNISVTYYDAGHMMYLRNSEQARLKEDLDQFFEAGNQP